MKSALAMLAALVVAGVNAGNYDYNSGDSGYGGYDTPSYDNDYTPYHPKPYHPKPLPPPPPPCVTCSTWKGSCPWTDKYTPYTWVRKYNYKKCVDYKRGGYNNKYFPDCNVVCCRKKKRPCPPRPKPKPHPPIVYHPPPPAPEPYQPEYDGGSEYGGSSGSNY